MTYICGFRNNGINFIICDTRITWNGRRDESSDIAVKSGYLFPGCIFARSGDMKTSGAFISTAKNRIDLRLSPVECWVRFLDFVNEYPFSKGHFSLLLSTRASGEPEYYYLDSKEGLTICPPTSVIGLGTGVQLLNPIVESTLKQVTHLQQQWPTDVMINDFPGYFLCHELSLYAQSYRRQVMDNYKVGGVFHFMAQTSHLEYRQRPSIYFVIVVDPSRNNIYLWIYRVASVLNGIVLETYFPPKQDEKYPIGGFGRDTFFDSTSTPDVDKIVIDNSASQEFRIRLEREIKSLEWCYYSGWGYADPKHWGSFGFQFNDENSKMPFTPEGELDRSFATDILKQLRSMMDLRGKVTLYFANKNGQVLQTEV